MSDTAKNQKFWNLAGTVVILFLCVEVVLLVRQNRALQENLQHITAGQPGQEALKVGEIAPPVKLFAMNGSLSELNYADPTKRHLVFIFSTTCPHCEATLPKWKSFVEGSRQATIVPVGICTDKLNDTKKFVDAKKPNFTVFAQPDTSFFRQYKLIGVPQTLVIGPNGTVEKIWVGELKPADESELRALTGASIALVNQQ